MATHAITDAAIVLKHDDDVAIAKREIAAGTVLEDTSGRIEARQDIRPDHKIARRAKQTGDPVRRYGPVIGFATADIAVGDHVHTHNLAVGDLDRDYELCTDVRPVDYYPPSAMRYFDGYQREDGRVGTRNYVAIISGVNCSASVSQFVKGTPLPEVGRQIFEEVIAVASGKRSKASSRGSARRSSRRGSSAR